MGIVFVAGVHAVGKSTACQQVSNDSGIAHFSASDLIKAERKNAITDQDKAVADVNGNQQLLLKAIDRKLSQTASHILLDGHFTLINAKGDIEPIGIELFEKLPLSGVVVYHDTPKSIIARMSERGGCVIQKNRVEYHQDLEIEHAQWISVELGIAIKLLNAFDVDGLRQVVSKWL